MKILLIEDDKLLCQSIEKQLTQEGYKVDTCLDGETALHYALNIKYYYDMAIIDRTLPIIDGLTIIKAMREKEINMPVIIISEISDLAACIEGLDGGADDYLLKPFHNSELSARIRALARRPLQIKATDVISYSNLSLEISKRRLCYNGNSVFLTAKESDLLNAFLQYPEQVLSREKLLYKVWGIDSEIELGNVDNYISFLRKRLKSLNSHVRIKTIYGTGYEMERG